VAISGDTAVVGAPGAGAAYVFARSGTTWIQQQKLISATPWEAFGTSVAISGDGNTIVVGATQGLNGDGKAYIFTRSNNGVWIPKGSTLIGPQTLGYFGYSVAISGDGNTVVVGAPGKYGIGAAYVYTYNGIDWGEPAIPPSGVTYGESFGLSVAISGNTVVVGAPDIIISVPGTNGPGAAYVFTLSNNTLNLPQTLTASDGAVDVDHFGCSVAISGNTMVVGALQNSDTAAAYVYTLSGTTWSQQGSKLTVSASTTPGDCLGGFVVIDGDIVVVGALQISTIGVTHVFTRSNGVWSYQQELIASDGADGDWFNRSVSISGDTVLVGAPHKNSSSGAAYAFTIPLTTDTSIQGGGALVSQVNGVTVGITGANAPNGTSVTIDSINYGNSAPSGTGAISLDGAQYYDVKVTPDSDLGPDAIARVSFTNSNVTPQTLMQYWYGGVWDNATNCSIDGLTISGDIPVSALSGTPIGIGTVDYGFLGLQSPYAAPPTSFKAGSAIPLKWQYTDSTGNVVDSSTANPQILINGIPAMAPGNSGLRYNPSTMTWQFNWKTTGFKAGYYTIQIKSGQTGQENDFLVRLR
jgi:hypothetical protein